MAHIGDNLWDALFGEIGRAVADVRQKVVQEPWFGRAAITPVGDMHRSVAQQLGWVAADGEPRNRGMTGEEHSLGATEERERGPGDMTGRGRGDWEYDRGILKETGVGIDR